ncbi:SpoIID/LytB domain-containing protein [Cohnella zeiphila]|uniref:SpoIID/LytB domain-containing protein n=1 Tax=Cohnella zeiphila TaxID=2761120 RepID=A0A7X0SG48_9BACL|nr:SpoIID/LytB domain-containing protein [Cohnella zeiphila]MBB6729342.1 SpoIID/LytB domain-containing protein [Cohnella zeiphila]
MIKRQGYKLARTALAGTLLAAIALGQTGAAGAVTVPDRIRVALFIDLGSQYQALTPAVTLVSSGGLKFALNGVALDSAEAGQSARFAVDGYRALVLETADLDAALTVMKKVQASSNAVFVTMLSKKGRSVYQVTEGNYDTAASATAALAKWTGAGVAVGVQTLSQPSVLGPWAVQAGPYASEEAAEAAAGQFGDAGLDAFVAIKPTGKAPAYYVRIGQAVDAGALADVQQKVAAAGKLASASDAGDPYVTIRQDMTVNGAANKPVPLYAIPSAAETKLAVSSATGGIQVLERSKRSYRGSMEISVLNKHLALVNELPLDEYLYSVVGSEVIGSWPAETLKAQAVAARSYALSLTDGFKIADVVDTTLSQTYNGIGGENDPSIAAVKATAGEVMTYQGKIIDAVFSSNAGGVTADNKAEVWGNNAPYLASAAVSPDEGPQDGKLDWYRVALPDGKIGYIRSDLLTDSGQKNAAGIELYQATGNDVAVRPSPQVSETADPIDRVNAGDQVVVLEKVPEYTNYAWVEGPLSAAQLQSSINKKATSSSRIQGDLRTLEVSAKGPSGRATQLTANGSPVDVGYPDNLRGALGGIKSTLIDIEETGRYTAIGANGQKKDFAGDASSVQILGASGDARAAGGGNLYILGAKDELRAATTDSEFIIRGKGYGHGLGMSQWGAKGLADKGYDYQSILKYYYKDVTIEKDGTE